MQFPVFKTKTKGVTKKFDLNNPKQREEYFHLKAGEDIRKIKDYLIKGNSFIVYLLGKKNTGKGTYSKMFAELIDPERIEHFSIGDMIRDIDKEMKDKKKKKVLVSFLEKNYRGWRPVKELITVLEKRSTKVLLPTELILALIKREIAKKDKKALLIDGFPRDMDQINFSLFFRDLVGYRDDPDLFVLIEVPESVIDERIRHRVVCPVCQTSRNLKLFPTSKAGYDEKKKEFYLLCDNPKCKEVKLVPKEGDSAGIRPIKQRLKTDEKLMNEAISLHGIPKIFLRNSVPKALAKQTIDDYEITPEYYYVWNKKKNLVEVKEKPWIILDDKKTPSYSLLPPPVVVSLIKQTAEVLNL